MPAVAGTWAKSHAPCPPIAAFLLPLDGKGGLETPCLKQLRLRHAAASACLETYLACVPQLSGSAEKHDKAALACLVAAVHPHDPTMTLARAFAGTTPLINVPGPEFTEVANALTKLLAIAG